MLPVVALVGRPNVGKSTLFNALTRKRDALVVDLPGTTRDRKYGESEHEGKRFILCDTGGVGDEENFVDDETTKQSWHAINEATTVLFVVDAKTGVSSADLALARELRKVKKPVHLVANKVDGVCIEVAMADMYSLGMGEPIPVAAKTKRGLAKLRELFTNDMIEDIQPSDNDDDISECDEPPLDDKVRVAIVGQPNVGKSTLINRMIGEYRLVVSDFSGTTRDSIEVPLERHGKEYLLIDTAGVRRRSKVSETVEKYSVIQSLQALEHSNVVVFMIDATKGLVDQDLSLIDYVIESGRGIVIAVNKWDGLDNETKQEIKNKISYRLQFAQFAKFHFISALHGSGVGNLFDSINEAYLCSTRRLPTPYLTRLLNDFVNAHPLPLVQGRRIKLRYAHSGGYNPPIIVIHGNQTDNVPDSYKRYLTKCFVRELKLVGTPLKLQFVTGENPYAGKRNTLTPRQERSRKRLMKFIKTGKKR